MKYLAHSWILIKRSGKPGFVVLFYVFISIFANVLANHEALLQIEGGSVSFPFLENSSIPTTQKDSPFSVRAIIPYDAGQNDEMNAGLISPFDKQYTRSDNGQIQEISWRNRHWLGTTKLGSDLLADMLYGSRISFLIALAGTFFAFLLGAIIGFLTGWFGPGSIRVPLSRILLILVSIVMLVFEFNSLNSSWDKWVGFFLIAGTLFILTYLNSKLNKWNISNIKLPVPIDGIFQRVSELFSGIPRIVLILTVMQLLTPSWQSVVIVLAISGWVDIARLIRSEIQRLKNQTFIEAAVVTGVNGYRLFMKQMMPNMWPTLIVVLLYTFAGNILIESSLSFLGFGLPADVVTLGSIISSGKIYYEAWWLVLFPGLWISVLIFSLFQLSARLRNINS